MKVNTDRSGRLKKILGACALLAVLGLTAPGCAEQHYYHRYHHHTRDWYGHHHQTPPAGVRFDVDVR